MLENPGTIAVDVLVVGSGVAGLTAAVRLAARGDLRVGVLTKGELDQSTTRFAQGGVAAALAGDEDSTDLHLADTLRAGAGLCDHDAVRVLVEEGPGRVEELIALGAVFDRLPGGDLALAREGGHSTARVVHAGGSATGAEVERTLVDAVRASATAILEGWFAVDLIVEGGRCNGLLALDPTGAGFAVRAENVLLAAGGAGQLYAVTTNPHSATGDGVAMALRAGVPAADVEFMQFHPTALHHPAMPRPLISEALRGHGALLRDQGGERFVDELAPRDVVSRAIVARMAEEGADHVFLDARNLDEFEVRFPNIAASLAEAGLDPTRDLLPVAPAAHHLAGGILTDLDGATALPGLWAAGETACAGVHGANRLASNSLLEGMVFGARVVEAVLSGRDGPRRTGVFRPRRDSADPHPTTDPVPLIQVPHVPHPAAVASATAASGAAVDLVKAREQLQLAMTHGAGVTRDASSLAVALAELNSLAGSLAAAPDGQSVLAAGELKNLLTAGRALLESAIAREETRGAHTRTDWPVTRDEMRLRLVHGEMPAALVEG
jgi:L-aspartate oxidase